VTKREPSQTPEQTLRSAPQEPQNLALMCYYLHMFPPEKTKDQGVAVTGLLASLSRAGLEIADCVQSNGKWCVRLRVMPPKNGENALRKYIRAYMKASGWKASSSVSRCRLWISAEELTSLAQRPNPQRTSSP
jgi:hypothetical protein